MNEERDLRAALQHAVAQICLEEEMSDSSANMSSQAVTALSELVYQYATNCLSNDLVSFAKHAGRRTITLEDVLLVARKDPQGLGAKLQAFAEKEKLSSSKKETKKKTAKKTKKQAETASLLGTQQRMKEIQERIKKGIDSSEESDSDSDAEMIEHKPQAGKSASLALNVDDSEDSDKGKENKKQARATMPEDDPFASSDEDATGKQTKKPAVVAEFPPGGTKSGFTDDSDSDDDMLDD